MSRPQIHAKGAKLTDLNCPSADAFFSAINFSSVSSQTAISGSGHSPTWRAEFAMSALPPIPDIRGAKRNVRFGLKVDIE
jgi:hypothetical protein